MKIKLLFIFFLININFSQTIDLNNDFNYNFLRILKLKGNMPVDYSLNIRPIFYEGFDEIFKYQNRLIFENQSKTIQIKSLGLDYFVELNTHHPYNRNNGTMIPNRGYQHIFSPGFFLKIGPLSIKLKPEHHYSENKKFDGFWDGHYPEVWAKRYKLWNRIDMPERFGNENHNSINTGQSSIRLNWKDISIGLSTENIWWGPSIRNSIMMSNHAQGFKHITFNTRRPIETIIGKFEWQLISGRLESSGFTPPRTDYEYAGTKLYIPKINQHGHTDDWRYLQGLIVSYSPKWIDGLSLGFIRWVQMYSELVKGTYSWIEGNPNYFPVFNNLFRKNDRFEDYEQQTNQAAGVFLNWLWNDSRSEIYFEFYHNDSKNNLRDLLLDADHSRAATIGVQKIFNIKNNEILFNWEWTQMEQAATRLVRNAGSWYEHSFVYDGYTNKGEVLGSSIGPGSNSHYFSLNKINLDNRIGVAIEVIDQDNDFYHDAFSNKDGTWNDYRRYWKDFNFHFNFNKSFKKFNLSSSLIFIRSLNYQWELDDYAEPYYHPGRDVNNFHASLKFTYFGF